MATTKNLEKKKPVANLTSHCRSHNVARMKPTCRKVSHPTFMGRRCLAWHGTLFCILAMILLSASASTNSIHPMNTIAFTESENLQSIVDASVRGALDKLVTNKLKSDQFAVSLVDLNVPDQAAAAGYRSNEKIYPASVIKLFYLVATHRWLEDGRLKDSAELRRAMRDMIVDSCNEATGLVVDSLTDTTSGPEMSPEDLDRWHENRNAVNRYFVSLGYTDINANRKPWNDGPYGRERQSVLVHKSDDRNMLTTGATARLMTEIMTGRAITAERCQQMQELLRRDPAETKAENQVKGFIGETLPAGSKLWSKAGWMSHARHDCAAFELPDGRKFVLVIFTVGHANEPEILQTLSRSVIAELMTSNKPN
jgi:beta-lactamase class A